MPEGRNLILLLIFLLLLGVILWLLLTSRRRPETIVTREESRHDLGGVDGLARESAADAAVAAGAAGAVGAGTMGAAAWSAARGEDANEGAEALVGDFEAAEAEADVAAGRTPHVWEETHPDRGSEATLTSAQADVEASDADADPEPGSAPELVADPDLETDPDFVVGEDGVIPGSRLAGDAEVDGLAAAEAEARAATADTEMPSLDLPDLSADADDFDLPEDGTLPGMTPDGAAADAAVAAGAAAPFDAPDVDASESAAGHVDAAGMDSESTAAAHAEIDAAGLDEAGSLPEVDATGFDVAGDGADGPYVDAAGLDDEAAEPQNAAPVPAQDTTDAEDIADAWAADDAGTPSSDIGMQAESAEAPMPVIPAPEEAEAEEIAAAWSGDDADAAADAPGDASVSEPSASHRFGLGESAGFDAQGGDLQADLSLEGERASAVDAANAAAEEHLATGAEVYGEEPEADRPDWAGPPAAGVAGARGAAAVSPARSYVSQPDPFHSQGAPESSGDAGSHEVIVHDHPVVDGGWSVGSAAPLEDGCMPLGHPIKGVYSLGIYQVPGSDWYDMTVPDVWFMDEESAQRAGFRRGDG